MRAMWINTEGIVKSADSAHVRVNEKHSMSAECLCWIKHYVENSSYIMNVMMGNCSAFANMTFFKLSVYLV